MNTQNHIIKPQEDVPTEVIIHYIVKDYQRMFLAFDEMKTRAEKAEAEILEMKEIHHKQIENRVKEIDNLRKEDKDRTNKLEEQLAAVQHQNRLLAQTVISNNSKGDGSVLFRGMVPADAKELEKKIGVQLSEALLKLTAAFEKLTYFQEKLENDELSDIEAANMDYFLSKVARTFNKIEASTQHIENFYKLVNGIPIL